MQRPSRHAAWEERTPSGFMNRVRKEPFPPTRGKKGIDVNTAQTLLCPFLEQIFVMHHATSVENAESILEEGSFRYGN